MASAFTSGFRLNGNSPHGIFRDAIELSRKTNAKSPELRATTSLARRPDTGCRD
jgi:hypothetical protein